MIIIKIILTLSYIEELISLMVIETILEFQKRNCFRIGGALVSGIINKLGKQINQIIIKET